MARGEPLFLGGRREAWDKQFVWPREGPKGRARRSWWGGFIDILSNKGPDMFITRKNDNTPIKPDQWGNWQVQLNKSTNVSTLTSHQGTAMIVLSLKCESFVKAITEYTMPTGETNAMNLGKESI
jgi:hypothetical protein